MTQLVRLQISAPSFAFTYGKKELRKTLRAAGTEVAQVARSLLRTAVGTGRVYRGSGGSAKAYRGGYKSGTYQASAAGQVPVRVTGTLANSIKVRPFKSGDGVAIRDNVFYALFLEKGAKGGGTGKGTRNKRGVAGSMRVLEPRMFLTTALDSRKASLEARIEASIRRDIAFVRQKA